MQRSVLARRAGVAANHLYMIETGARTPSLGLVEKIAHELRVEPAELLRETAHASRAAASAGVEANVGAHELSDLMHELNTPSMNLLDPELTTVLKEASAATVEFVLGQVEEELRVLVPEFRRLDDELEPTSKGYMQFNKAYGFAIHQIAALRTLLRSRTEPEFRRLSASLQSLLKELVGATS